MPKSMRLSSRALPVLASADVVVCGGGPAGSVAAVAAARAGAKVILLEAQGSFGGLGASGLVPCFCPVSDGKTLWIRGIGLEVMKLMALYMRVPLEYDWMPIHAESLKKAFDDLIVSSGAVYRLMTRVVAVTARRGRIDSVVVATHEGLAAVTGKVVIDATGDGDVAAWAGAPYALGGPKGELQSPTLCFAFAGVDWKAFDRHRRPGSMRPDQLLWRDAHKRRRAPLEDRHLTTGILRTGPSTAGINAGHMYGTDGLDEASASEALVAGRRKAWTFLRWYRKAVPGCANAELSATASLLGVRETRRVMGDYCLTRADYLRREHFPDDVGVYSYPIDVHASTVRGERSTQTEFLSTRYAEGETYGIPYRALIPRKLANVLVAGRCISADRAMQGSTRVMPACFITGHAAGAAAAIAARMKSPSPRDVNVRRLQSMLREQGAYLP